MASGMVCSFGFRICIQCLILELGIKDQVSFRVQSYIQRQGVWLGAYVWGLGLESGLGLLFRFMPKKALYQKMVGLRLGFMVWVRLGFSVRIWVGIRIRDKDQDMVLSLGFRFGFKIMVYGQSQGQDSALCFSVKVMVSICTQDLKFRFLGLGSGLEHLFSPTFIILPFLKVFIFYL